MPASLGHDAGPGWQEQPAVVELPSMRDSLGEDPLIEVRDNIGLPIRSGKDQVTFGKHAGMTYDEVYKKHPSYCNWVMHTAEVGDDPGASLVKFARHLATREARSPEDVPAGRMDEAL